MTEEQEEVAPIISQSGNKDFRIEQYSMIAQNLDRDGLESNWSTDVHVKDQ